MNHTIKTLLAVSAIVLSLSGCRRTDVRDFSVEIPSATEADLPALSAALAQYGGVARGSLKFDAAKHVLQLKYDSMQIAKKNIEMAIAGAGFAANGVTPESIGAKPRK